MLTREQAKVDLKKKGWSYRTAAPALEVSSYHLNQVLNGYRESARLLSAIAALPRRDRAPSTRARRRVFARP